MHCCAHFCRTLQCAVPPAGSGGGSRRVCWLQRCALRTVDALSQQTVLQRHNVSSSIAGFTSGLCSRHLVLLPAAAVVQAPRRMDPRGKLFRSACCCASRRAGPKQLIIPSFPRYTADILARSDDRSCQRKAGRHRPAPQVIRWCESMMGDGPAVAHSPQTDRLLSDAVGLIREKTRGEKYQQVFKPFAQRASGWARRSVSSPSLQMFTPKKVYAAGRAGAVAEEAPTVMSVEGEIDTGAHVDTKPDVAGKTMGTNDWSVVTGKRGVSETRCERVFGASHCRRGRPACPSRRSRTPC